MNTKLIALASLVVLVAGCSVEEPERSIIIEQNDITISAYRADEQDTKTQRDESNGAVLWSPGDAISLSMAVETMVVAVSFPTPSNQPP